MATTAYDQYVLTMQTMLVSNTNNTDVGFQNILPSMIEYAELRMYREFDFLTTISSLVTALTANSRNATMPATPAQDAAFVVLNSVNVITPAATLPDAGTRNPLRRVSIEFLNWVYPSVQNPGVPAYYAMLNDTSPVLGPAPDQAYNAEFIMTVRPQPLSPSNTSTFITTNLWDIFIAASMVFGAGYKQNYGAQSDDPKLAMSWEAQYQTLKASGIVEEARKKAEGAQWSAYQPPSVANVVRDKVA